jgi:hypothetical protein
MPLSQTRAVSGLKEGRIMRPLRALLVVFVMSLGVLAAESPFSGTWKLNLSKSKMSPPPQSETVQVDADDNSIKVIAEGINDKGQSMTTGYEANFDGKDYPMTGIREGESISFQRIDANTLKATVRKNGKVIGGYTVVVSTDGKTTTVNYTETDEQGKEITGSAVYDKQ